MHLRRAVPSAAALAAAAVLLAACGSSPADTGHGAQAGAARPAAAPVGISGGDGATVGGPEAPPGGAPTATSTGAGPAAAPTRDPATVFTLGDSVMLGARRCLRDDGFTVDSRGNRQPRAGIAVLQERAAAGTLPEAVVVHLGTNGGMRASDIDKMMEVAGPDRQVWFFTVQLPDDTSRYTFEDRTNDAIHDAPARFPNAHVIDWNALTGTGRKWSGGDGIHLSASGCTLYAETVAKAVGAPAGG